MPGGGYWLLRFSRAENVVKMQGTLGWRTNGRRWMGHGPAGGGLPEGQGGGQLQGGYHDQLDQLKSPAPTAPSKLRLQPGTKLPR